MSVLKEILLRNPLQFPLANTTERNPKILTLKRERKLKTIFTIGFLIQKNK